MNINLGRHLAFARRAGVVASLLVAALAAPAQGSIAIASDSANSQNHLGQFTGSIDYGFNLGANAWQVQITLTNTTPAPAGYITGVIFNIASSDPNAKATLVSGPANFSNAPNQNGGPFGGPYRAGAALGGNFNGGGSYTQGLGGGQTGIFRFTVMASDAAALTDLSFINGPLNFDFLVRFRGLRGVGSDRVPGMVVPGPTVLGVLAVGLMLGRSRRRSA
jgi:hypothetical protein